MHREFVALRMVCHFSRGQRIVAKSKFGLSDWSFKVSHLSPNFVLLVYNFIALLICCYLSQM